MNEDKPYLAARNRYNDKEHEEVYHHYLKRGKGYFLDAFFGAMFWKCFLFAAAATLLYVIAKVFFSKMDIELLYIFCYCFMALAALVWIVDLSVKLWAWKYVKHVVVTNQGIWIMIYGHAFWGGKSYDGKKHFFSVAWSFYSWTEVTGVFPDDSRISKLCGLKNFAMTRWDGEQSVEYLAPDEVAEIESISYKHINPKRRRKTRPQKRRWKISDFIGPGNED